MRTKPEVVTIDPGAVQRHQVLLNERFRLTAEGNLFIELVRIGMNPPLNSGQQMPVDDVINRAWQLTVEAFLVIDKNEWFVDVPGWPGELIARHNEDKAE